MSVTTSTSTTTTGLCERVGGSRRGRPTPPHRPRLYLPERPHPEGLDGTLGEESKVGRPSGGVGSVHPWSGVSF